MSSARNVWRGSSGRGSLGGVGRASIVAGLGGGRRAAERLGDAAGGVVWIEVANERETQRPRRAAQPELAHEIRGPQPLDRRELAADVQPVRVNPVRTGKDGLASPPREDP